VTNAIVGCPVEQVAAFEWVRRSLEQGSSLAMLMSQHLGSLTFARLLVPAVGGQFILDDRGRGIPQRDSDAIVRALFQCLGPDVLKSLIVEDDLARRGDPSLGSDVAFVDDRALRWCDMDDAVAAGALLREGSSGYPLNSFGCRASPAELGLAGGRTLVDVDKERIIDSTELVIVSVYDAEAYLVLMKPVVEALLA
jgi:hypothetical protein